MNAAITIHCLGDICGCGIRKIGPRLLSKQVIARRNASTNAVQSFNRLICVMLSVNLGQNLKSLPTLDFQPRICASVGIR